MTYSQILNLMVLKNQQKINKVENDSATGSPKTNKGTFVGAGKPKSRGYGNKRLRSNIVELKSENKLPIRMQSLRCKIPLKKTIPKYEFIPDKLSLRKMILRCLNEQNTEI